MLQEDCYNSFQELQEIFCSLSEDFRGNHSQFFEEQITEVCFENTWSQGTEKGGGLKTIILEPEKINYLFN